MANGAASAGDLAKGIISEKKKRKTERKKSTLGQSTGPAVQGQGSFSSVLGSMGRALGYLALQKLQDMEHRVGAGLRE